MKISFITASYNYEQYIGETIKSVQAQTVHDWEMIIIDDGSGDNSVKVIKSFAKKDSRIKLFQHPDKKNHGLAPTIRLGLEKANGDWIVFLESDDTIEPNYLAEKLKIIDKYPSVKFIFNNINPVGNTKGMVALNRNTGCEYFKEMHKRVNNIKWPAQPFAVYQDFNFVPTFSCVMLKKEILKNVSFNSPIRQWLDTYLWSQLVGRYDFFYTKKKLTNWRLHDNSYNNNKLTDAEKQRFMEVIHKTIESSRLNKLARLYFKIKQLRRRLIRIHPKKKEIIIGDKIYSFAKQYVPNQDTISVILPVYNAEENIVKCLSSVLNQSHSNLEVIVVYLKGTDNTLKLIKSFKDTRIKIVNQLTKTGPGGARNIGLNHVSGKYVGFIEADDYIPANFYEKLYKEIITSGADVSVCEIVEPRADGTESYITQITENKACKTLTSKLKTMTNGAAFNKLIKASIIKKHKLKFTEHWRFEDNPWLLKVLYYAHRVKLTNSVKYYYCCQGEQWTEKYVAFLKESIPPIAKEMVDFAKCRNFSNKDKNLVGKIIMNSFVRNFIQDESVYKNLQSILGPDFFYKHAYVFNREYGFSFNVQKSKLLKFKEKLLSRKTHGPSRIFYVLGIKIHYKSLKVAYKNLEQQLNVERASRQALEHKLDALIKNEEAARYTADTDIRNFAGLLETKIADADALVNNLKKAVQKIQNHTNREFVRLDNSNQEISKKLKANTVSVKNLGVQLVTLFQELDNNSKKISKQIHENALSIKNLNVEFDTSKQDFEYFKQNNILDAQRAFDKKYPQMSQYEIIGNKVREKMGAHSYACQYFTVATDKTTVGKFCSIADNVSLGTTHHPTSFLSSHPFCYFEPVKLTQDASQVKFKYVSPVHIGNDVWIGKHVTIMDGITVGDGAIIGTNAVVTKDVPPYAIVAGVPAKVLRYRFSPKIIQELLKLKWWNLPEDKLKNLPYDNVEKCINLLKK